jgi:hypothetical protein
LSRHVVKNPAAAVKFYDFIIRHFLEVLLGGGMLGKLEAYFGVDEAQGRGTMHFNVLLWSNDKPERGQTAKRVFHFIVLCLN